MLIPRSGLLAGATLFALASSLYAQANPGPRGVPRGQWPPSGLCRIWIDGIAPGRQPAPTDCATAERQADYGIHLLYGGDNRRPQRYRDVGRRPTSTASAQPQNQGGWGTYRPGDTLSNNGGDTNDGGYGSNGGYGNSGGYDTNGGYGNATGRDDGTCYDRNRDGRCDEVTPGTSYPNAAGQTGRRGSDGYPTEAPQMDDALQFRDGIRDDQLTRWIGQGAARVTVGDANRDGRYETALFVGQDGKPVQGWTDSNGDGAVEQIRIYQDGKVVSTITR